MLCKQVITNHASRLVFRNDLDLKWPPQSMYYAQNGSNSAVDGLHVKISSEAAYGSVPASI